MNSGKQDECLTTNYATRNACSSGRPIQGHDLGCYTVVAGRAHNRLRRFYWYEIGRCKHGLDHCSEKVKSHAELSRLVLHVVAFGIWSSFTEDRFIDVDSGMNFTWVTFLGDLLGK